MLHKCYSVGWLPQIYVDSGEMSGLWSEEDLWVEIRLQQWGEIMERNNFYKSFFLVFKFLHIFTFLSIFNSRKN